MKRSFSYARDIIRALDRLGGCFAVPVSPGSWAELGDVDIVFLDKQGRTLGATIAHEGMLIASGEADFAEFAP